MAGKKRMAWWRKALVLSACCSASMLAYAAKPGSAANTAGRPDDKAFDPSVASLPRAYACADFAGMIAELARMPEKNATEAAPAFEQRLVKWAQTRRPGLPVIGQLTAFCAPAEDVAGVEYDDEDEKLTVTLWDSYDEIDGLRFVPLVSRTERKTGSVSVNAAGERVRFSRQTSTRAGLAMARKSPFQIDRLRYAVDAPRAAAADIAENLQMAIIGRVTAPFGLREKDVSEPSVDDPIEETTLSTALHFSLEKVWLFHRKTGQVFLRIEPY